MIIPKKYILILYPVYLFWNPSFLITWPGRAGRLSARVRPPPGTISVSRVGRPPASASERVRGAGAAGRGHAEELKSGADSV